MIEINFFLEKEKEFRIAVPDLPNKVNYYYEPTGELHRFDEAMVSFIDKDCGAINLKKDIIDEILCNLYRSLKSALNYDLALPSNVKVGCLGYLLNQYLNDLNSLDVFPYWMWSSNMNIATLLYNFEDKVYLEIVPIYPWTFLEPVEGDGYITLEEFMKHYKPYVVETIAMDIAMQWYNQSQILLKKLNSACL